MHSASFLKMNSSPERLQRKLTEKKNMNTLIDLREKITRLELEKAELLADVEALREKAEAKSESLEEEVAKLREEAESLKKLLDAI